MKPGLLDEDLESARPPYVTTLGPSSYGMADPVPRPPRAFLSLLLTLSPNHGASHMSIEMAEMLLEPQVHVPKKVHSLCRICQSSGNAHDLIRPCMVPSFSQSPKLLSDFSDVFQCSGSSAYVHRACLNRWRAVSPYPDAVTKCEFCDTGN